MMLNRLLTFSAAAVLAMTLGASAAPVAYTLDKNHTDIRFCWNHLGVSRQCGHFLKYEGELDYDAANPENSTLNVTFKTDSIETLVPALNDHMKRDALFDAKKYPDATFKSTKFEKTGEKTGKVTGDLTIKGVTKTVTLDVTLNFAGPHPLSRKNSLGIGASATVKRTDFGVSEYAPMVSDDITIEIQSELNQKS